MADQSRTIVSSTWNRGLAGVAEDRSLTASAWNRTINATLPQAPSVAGQLDFSNPDNSGLLPSA